MKNPRELENILESISEKPIVFLPIYAKITGSVTAGLLLSQLLYWRYAMHGKEFYKTDEDFCHELSMGLWELKNAKKILSELKIIKMRRKGIPAKTHYKIDIGRICQLILESDNNKLSVKPTTGYDKNQRLDVGKNNNKSEGKATTITESNAENKKDIITDSLAASPPRPPAEALAGSSADSLTAHQNPAKNFLKKLPENAQFDNSDKLLSGKDNAPSQVNEIISAFKTVCPTSYDRLYANRTQRAATERLIAKIGFEELFGAVTVLDKVNQLPYVSKTVTPLELERNFDKIKYQIQNQQQIQNSKFKISPELLKDSHGLNKARTAYYKKLLADFQNS